MMHRLFLVVATLIASVVVSAASVTTASASTEFFDPATKQWIKYGSRLRSSGKSPIKRKVVSYDGKYAPGTIIVDTEERRLYHVLPGGKKARKYGIGVGRDGFQWAGVHHVSRKAEWPGWTPPPAMRARAARNGQKLPAHMEGGPNNPLGARAMYIGATIYRIHGSNEPWSIGQAVSSGCIRMANEDVMHLYENVDVGAKVVVRR